MMKCDQGFDMTPVQIRQHLPVAINCRAIPVALRWLDTTPLDAQAQHIVFHLFGQGKIFLRLPPPVRCIETTFARAYMPCFFPAIPLIVVVPTLALMRRGCRSPQKPFWKAEATLP